MTFEDTDNENEDSFSELRVNLENDVLDKLEKIKIFYGIKNKTEIIRFLITKEFRLINKKKIKT